MHAWKLAEEQNITGKYFNGQKEVTSSTLSYDTAAAEKLWRISESLLIPSL
jgi:hypothetical protein